MTEFTYMTEGIRKASGVPDKNKNDFLVGLEKRNDEQKKFVELIRGLFEGKYWSITVLGTVGNGKTTIGCSSVNHWNSVNYFFDEPAYYKTQSELVLEFKDTYNHDSTKTESALLTEYARKAKLLVIDELNPKEWTETNRSLIQRILLERYANRRMTILIGNLTAKKLKEMFDPHIISRLREGQTLFMLAPDMRVKTEF